MHRLGGQVRRHRRGRAPLLARAAGLGVLVTLLVWVAGGVLVGVVAAVLPGLILPAGAVVMAAGGAAGAAGVGRRVGEAVDGTGSAALLAASGPVVAVVLLRLLEALGDGSPVGLTVLVPLLGAAAGTWHAVRGTRRG